MSKLRRVYDAVKTLGMRDREIEDNFAIRNELPLYEDIENNKFFPSINYSRANRRNRGIIKR
jgi:hypothetical protein